MSSCISSCVRRCSLSRSRRSRTPSTKMSARRASFLPGNKRRQGKRVREKSKRKRHADGVPFLRPSGAISCRILPSAKQAGQALRRAPHKIPRKSPALPDFYSSARAAAARPRPPHPRAPSLALSGQFTLCGREGGIVSGFSGTGNVSRGDSVPPGRKPAGTEKGRLHSQTAFSTKSR